MALPEASMVDDYEAVLAWRLNPLHNTLSLGNDWIRHEYVRTSEIMTDTDGVQGFVLGLGPCSVLDFNCTIAGVSLGALGQGVSGTQADAGGLGMDLPTSVLLLA